MNIILDNIVFSLQKAGGISTYWFELSSRILRDYGNAFFVDRENENIVSKNLIISKERILKSGISNLLLDRFMNIRLNGVSDNFIFHSSYNRITTNRNAKQVLTIHDFVHERFYTGMRKLLHSYQKGKAIKNADAIIVISENTKKDLMFFFQRLILIKLMSFTMAFLTISFQ
ncbi:hypothetical protein [Flavobacterium sp. 1]|uniref:hypothetical protein n=1 Tax=Flavobacterium sp. 1 TaxID=2035200 RepID=UPI000C247554|nr:hypothetical protein [Flavobacterium sp. 1]